MGPEPSDRARAERGSVRSAGSRGSSALILSAIVVVASNGCGLDVVGSGPDGASARGPSAPASSGTESTSVDGGRASSADAGADAPSAAPPCTTCSETCLQACPVCPPGSSYCIARGACVESCEGCATGERSCTTCDLAGQAPRGVCSPRNGGFCATGQYPRCGCATNADCNYSEVCAAGRCASCGDPGTDGLACRGCRTCSAATRDCRCD